MAKFCTMCGKPLEDGKPCSCRVSNEKDALALSSATARKYINLFIETLKGIFKKPVDTIKQYSKSENFGFGVAALLINSLIIGIFLYCLLTESIELLQVGTLSSFFYTDYDISFLKMILLGFIFAIVGFIVTIAMIYIMTSLAFKNKIDFKKITALVGVCSVLTTITTLVATIILYLSFTLSIFLLVVGGLFYLVYLYQGISEITTVNKNKLAYIYVPTLMITFFVVVYILPRIFN